jgi:hypothetical protein
VNKYRGNGIYEIDGEWFYNKNDLKVKDNIEIECGMCGYKPIKDGDEAYDTCIGKLIGVMNACCGHGDERDAYVQFIDGESVYGKDAVDIMQILKKY